ncbi:hypothetical protein DV737_g5591, partial [Chaetothyriales sp. CBS 132003]
MMARMGKRKFDGEETVPIRTSPRSSRKTTECVSVRQPVRQPIRSTAVAETEEDLPIVETGAKKSKVEDRKPASFVNGSSGAHDTQTLSQDQEASGSDDEDVDKVATKPKSKRKAKQTGAEAMPLAVRTPGLKMFVGAHTSVAKGVENAISNSVQIGGNAFACFLKSQRKWENAALKDENRDAFKRGLITHKYDSSKHIVPHGSYLVNLASADKDMATKSYKAFVDDLGRCEALGIKHYNFHPGSAGQSPLADAIERLAAQLNRALAETSTVVALLENMATRGSIIGGKFEDLRDIIALIKPEFKHRIGICIDTCHAFASGYDLRTPQAFKQTLIDLDAIVGIQYVKALHLNDSKAPFASHRDLHQNIGLGFLGLRAFHNVMNEERFQDLPLILETPCEKPDPKDAKKTVEDRQVWAAEIKLLESLIGMDPDGAEFIKLDKDLSDKGRADRAKMQKQFEEKQAKEMKKLSKEKDKAQKSLKDMFTGGEKKAKKQQQQPQRESDEEECIE